MSDSIRFDASRRIAEEFTKIGTDRRAAPKTAAGESFQSMLSNLVSETDTLQKTADSQIADVVAGRKDNVSEVMLAMSKADLSFKMMLEVRNKLLEAYQEVMRMQV